MLKIIAFIALVLFAGFVGGHIETGNQWADIILSMINGLLLGYGIFRDRGSY